MGVERPDLIETLVSEEIRRMVANAIETGSLFSTSHAASEIRRIYPTCGLDARQLTDRIIQAASVAGVAVEIGEANPDAKMRKKVQTAKVGGDPITRRAYAASADTPSIEGS